MNRANAVKEASDRQSTRSSIPTTSMPKGMGWDHAGRSGNDPENHAKNRRVEIKVYTAEKQ